MPRNLARKQVSQKKGRYSQLAQVALKQLQDEAKERAVKKKPKQRRSESYSWKEQKMTQKTSKMTIVESMYKSCRRFVFGIWTCAKLKKFFRMQDVCSATFPQDECTWLWTSKNSKVVFKKWEEEATWNEKKSSF